MGRDSIWTEEEEAIIRKRYGEGFPATRIADFVFAVRGIPVTRNSVIGKIHRLPDMPPRRGKPKDPEAAKPKVARQQPSKPSIVTTALAVQKVRRAPPPPLIVVEPVPTGLIGVLELTSTTCRWPIGDPGTKGFHFCGTHMDTPFSEASPNTAYCEYHSKVGYNGFSFWKDPNNPRIPMNQWNKMGKVA